MAYATGRTYFDADSHVMETADWIVPYLDPALRGRVPALSVGGFDSHTAAAMLADRASDPEFDERSATELMTAKGWDALGAWDRDERGSALDLLGFDAQLVFTTAGLFPMPGIEDPDVRYGVARALNRAIADFCGDDPRLLGVGYAPLNDPERARIEAELAIELGCAAVMVPTAVTRDVSPTHPTYDGFWEALVNADVPFVVHIGGGGRLLPESFRMNGRPIPADFVGGGENIRSKDFVSLHRSPELFLSMLVLDGLFDRFGSLRGGCMEQGCEWVVTLLRRLDQAQDAFARNEPDLKALQHRASHYVREHLKFAPFPFEDVGWVTEQVGSDVLVFGTDYPHIEGGRDPLARFERSFDARGISEDAKRKFYSENFAALMGAGVRHLVPA